MKMKAYLRWLAGMALGAACAMAQDDPLVHDASVTINTNTIRNIVAAFDKSEPPAALFAKLPELIKVYGVTSVSGQGSSSGGAAAMASLVQITDGTLLVDVGPAYVVGVDANSDLLQGVEVAFSTSFPAAGKIQEKFQQAVDGVPVLDLLPRFIDLSGFRAFLGAGATLGGAGSWSPTGWIVSAGAGGIKFGK